MGRILVSFGVGVVTGIVAYRNESTKAKIEGIIGRVVAKLKSVSAEVVSASESETAADAQ